MLLFRSAIANNFRSIYYTNFERLNEGRPGIGVEEYHIRLIVIQEPIVTSIPNLSAHILLQPQVMSDHVEIT